MIQQTPLELAMTHRVVGGVTERCLRPPHVIEMAQRMQRWQSTPETCQSCQSLPAVSVRAGLPICSRCRENRGLHVMVDRAGMAPRSERSDDVGESDAQFQGYSIVFNSRSVDLGGFVEIVRPSAADRMEAEKPDMLALWNHDSSAPIGRVSAGTHRARKATKGVAIEIDPPRWASNYLETVERRDVVAMSFAFMVVTDDWHMENDEVTRELLDMRVYESSPVSFPAYPATSVRVVRRPERSRWNQQATDSRLRLSR